LRIILKYYTCILCIGLLAGCATPAKVSTHQRASEAATIKQNIKKEFWEQPEFQNSHIGVSVYDVDEGKYLYNYQGDKYFLPASNTKIFTLYMGMKYLKDSLPGIRYRENADTFFIYPTGDPSLLHPDFKKQPVIEKLQKTKKKLVLIDNAWKETALGSGWAWDDYNDDYQSERSSLPVYGNMINWIQASQKNTQAMLQDSVQTFVYSEPEINWKVRFKEDTLNKTFFVKRKKEENYFEISQGKELLKKQSVPFVTNGDLSALELLKDTVNKEITILPGLPAEHLATIYSQPSDSLFKIMMHRSDNFYAEQTLLMVSNEMLGYMNDAAIIDTILSSTLKELPQKPSWVDGSGLSRYNLFTPQDFVWILNKMKADFGMERIKAIFAGAEQGTLRNYFAADKGFIFAKTGSLTGQIALSGFLITRKNKLLTFSVLVNNYLGSASSVRMAVAKFLSDTRLNN
jgi:D-alanyl-D-alanine carboxypeptidase/D-alanyl-D-alanine-endopeptidase (penicillin-binding protein 4)